MGLTPEESRLTALAMIDAQPLPRADAVVVLCGQDGLARLKVGVGAVHHGGARKLVLSGGLSAPPTVLGAADLEGDAYDMGITPDWLLLEKRSTNTHEQAQRVLEMADTNGWQRLIVAASTYHVHRAFLTFVAVLRERDDLKRVHIVPVPASQTSWFEAPPGLDLPRRLLFLQEMAKIEQYRQLGHCATWQEAIDYLEHWDRK